MKKNICLLILLFICSPHTRIYGQNGFFSGIKGGLSIPNLSTGSGNSNPLANGYKSRLGANICALAEFPLNKRVSLQTEFCYSEQGGKHDGMQALTNPFPQLIPQKYLYADFSNEAKLHYFLLPVQIRLNFDIKAKVKLYMQGGMFAGILLSAKTVTQGSGYLYADEYGMFPLSSTEQSFDHTEDIYNKLNLFNTGVIGAVGFSREICRGKLFIEGGGNYGFINIQKRAEDGRNYTGAGTVQFGYAHHFAR